MTEAPTKADERASFAIYEAIAGTLQSYIDGARTGDSALMRKAFLETAHIRGSYSGKPVDWTLSEFCELIDKNGPAPEIAARIVTIDHSEAAAMARLEAENWRGTIFGMRFTLRLDGAPLDVALPLGGPHFVQNFLADLLPLERAKQGRFALHQRDDGLAARQATVERLRRFGIGFKNPSQLFRRQLIHENRRQCGDAHQTRATRQQRNLAVMVARTEPGQFLFALAIIAEI